MSDVDTIRRALSQPVPAASKEGDREAAVAAVFFGEGPSLDLLFIERATVEGDPWSGHVAFPGGRREDHDPTLLETAVRETHEELGLDLHLAEHLGVLHDVGPVSRRKPLVVRPHVFYMPTLPELTPNREVAAVHTLGLARLLGNDGRGSMPYEWQGQQLALARVDFSNVRLWGLTLRIVDDLLHRLDGEGTGLRRVGGEGIY